MTPSWTVTAATLLLGWAASGCVNEAGAPVGAGAGELDASVRRLTPAAEDAALPTRASAALPDAGSERDTGLALDEAGPAMDAGDCTGAGADRPGVTELGCDPRWRTMPSMPEGFEAFYAENPSCLLDLAWVACGAGCRRLADDPRFRRYPGSGWAESGGAFFSVNEVVRESCSGGPEAIRVVTGADGGVVAGFLFDYPQVRLGWPAGGDGWMGFDLTVGREDAEGHLGTVHHLLYYARRGAFTAAVDPVQVLSTADPPWRPWDSVSPYPWRVGVSGTTLSADVYKLRRLLVVEGSRSRWIGRSGYPGESVRPGLVLVGHESFWSEGGDVVHVTLDTEPSIFLSRDPGDWIESFATDGVDLAWVRVNPDPGTSCYLPGRCTAEFWTAPYVSDPNSLRPHQVGSPWGVGGEAVVGDVMHVAFYEYGRYSLAVDLRDGRRRRWDVPPRWRVHSNALWTHAGEVAFTGSIHGTRSEDLLLISLADAYRSVL